MQKMILIIAALLLMTSANISVHAQNTEKEEPEKTTTVDAWQQALPESEQPSNAIVVMDESTNRVEAKETPAQVEKRILDLEQKLMEALKGRDSVALKSLLADDFVPVGVNITAAQPDKTRFIEWSLKNSEMKSAAVEKTMVRVYQSTAIVTVKYKQPVAVGGVAADGNFIVTDVWVRREKQWQAVSHHVSPLPKP